MKSAAVVAGTALIVLVFGTGLFYHEYIRWQGHKLQCIQHWEAHLLLTRDPVCINPRKRLLFTQAGTVDCVAAERAIRIDPVWCAWAAYWREGIVASVLQWMEHSVLAKLMLFGLLAEVVYLLITTRSSSSNGSGTPPPPVQLFLQQRGPFVNPNVKKHHRYLLEEG